MMMHRARLGATGDGDDDDFSLDCIGLPLTAVQSDAIPCIPIDLNLRAARAARAAHASHEMQCK